MKTLRDKQPKQLKAAVDAVRRGRMGIRAAIKHYKLKAVYSQLHRYVNFNADGTKAKVAGKRPKWSAEHRKANEKAWKAIKAKVKKPRRKRAA